ncbi:MAG: DUF2868 domain-containing protein [Rubrivivax sp.]|nr:DUF2868 domain-containing protein [Rubrivivax sp.]
MTEEQARQVLLLQARESEAPSALWSADDRRWATREAVAAVGDDARPEAFVVARATAALTRLLPRDAAGRRWLSRRGWHPAWVGLALLLGWLAGLAADQLGAPQRVNLLAPAVWAVVAWNLVVYAAMLLPLPRLGLRDALARWGLGSDEGPAALWARHAAPLQAARAALVLHAGAAALGLGLVAGLYVRGLVLDYRAGWQSTFLDAQGVQQALQWLLAPARWATGIPLPDVAPLRIGPGAEAVASAAPWIHLYAATLVIFVLLPRGLLALRAAWQAGRRSRRFPLPLDTPYFEALHPLMRPGLPRVLPLLWGADRPGLTLLGTPVGAMAQPLTLLRSDEGDELQLRPVPPGLAEAAALAAAPRGWWATVWGRPDDDLLPRLREQVAAVLLVTAPGAPRPEWLAALGRPVVALVDGPAAEPPALPLHARDDGWLAEGRLLHALSLALDDDPRLTRLTAAWTARQRERLDAGVAELADTLARVACAREAVADVGRLASGRAEAETARQALGLALEAELAAHGVRLATLLGLPAANESPAHPVPATLDTLPVPAAALRKRVDEGRSALVAGLLGGALTGLKADVLSGGLTMGTGAVVGALVGALGAAGAARGLNVVRGTDRNFVTWDEEVLAPVTAGLLARYAVLAHGMASEVARERLVPALAAQQGTLATLWRTRSKRFDNAGEATPLALALRQPLADALVQAVGGPRL